MMEMLLCLETTSERRAAILSDLRARGVRLTINSRGEMKCSDPSEVLSDFERAGIKSCSAGLTYQLRRELGLCGLCGGGLQGKEKGSKTCAPCVTKHGRIERDALADRLSGKKFEAAAAEQEHEVEPIEELPEFDMGYDQAA